VAPVAIVKGSEPNEEVKKVVGPSTTVESSEEATKPSSTVPLVEPFTGPEEPVATVPQVTEATEAPIEKGVAASPTFEETTLPPINADHTLSKNLLSRPSTDVEAITSRVFQDEGETVGEIPEPEVMPTVHCDDIDHDPHHTTGKSMDLTAEEREAVANAGPPQASIPARDPEHTLKHPQEHAGTAPTALAGATAGGGSLPAAVHHHEGREEPRTSTAAATTSKPAATRTSETEPKINTLKSTDAHPTALDTAHESPVTERIAVPVTATEAAKAEAAKDPKEVAKSTTNPRQADSKDKSSNRMSSWFKNRFSGKRDSKAGSKDIDPAVSTTDKSTLPKRVDPETNKLQKVEKREETGNGKAVAAGVGAGALGTVGAGALAAEEKPKGKGKEPVRDTVTENGAAAPATSKTGYAEPATTGGARQVIDESGTTALAREQDDTPAAATGTALAGTAFSKPDYGSSSTAVEKPVHEEPPTQGYVSEVTGGTAMGAVASGTSADTNVPHHEPHGSSLLPVEEPPETRATNQQKPGGDLFPVPKSQTHEPGLHGDEFRRASTVSAVSVTHPGTDIVNHSAMVTGEVPHHAEPHKNPLLGLEDTPEVRAANKQKEGGGLIQVIKTKIAEVST